MGKRIVFGVLLGNRFAEAGAVQKIFTDYGCNIKTRLGLHEVDATSCSPKGLILLEMFGDEAKCFEMADKLSAIEGVGIQKMVFENA